MDEDKLAFLDIFRVQGAPSTVYYIRDFISQQEAEYLHQKVYTAPIPKWKTIDNRRVQNWGGYPHPKGMFAEKIPDWLTLYCERIGKLKVFEKAKYTQPNHILINEYPPGIGIMPHEDGPLYYPTIATISLSSHTVLDFYKHPKFQVEQNEGVNTKESLHMENHEILRKPDFSLVVQRGSLLILQDEMYTNYLHGIAPRRNDVMDESMVNLKECGVNIGESYDRQLRVSLTFRVIEKVMKAKIF